MNYYSISALINALVSLFLGVFVLYKRPKERLNQSLFMWCLTVFVWSSFYFIWQLEQVEYMALFWTRMLMFGAVWVPITFFRVVIIFLNIERAERLVYRVSFYSSLVFTFLLPTPLMVRKVEPVMSFRYWPKPGLIYPLFLFLFIGLTAYGAYLSYRALKTSSIQMRAQIKFMLFGMMISIVGGSTNYFLWYNIPIKPFGNILVLVYVFFTVYAIVVYRLMDIKFVLRKYAVYLVSFLAVIVPVFIFQYSLRIYLGQVFSWHDVLLIVVPVAVAVSVFPVVRDYFYRLANKFFFSSLYDGRQVITTTSEQLQSTLDVEQMYDFISKIILDSFHAKEVEILTYDEHTGLYESRHEQTEADSGFVKLSESRNSHRLRVASSLQRDFLDKGNIVIVDELKSQRVEEYREAVEYLERIGVAVLIPLVAKEKNIGLIVLASKESGDVYNSEDIYVLKVIGTQIAISLENALLYDETLDFNEKLKHEVRKATAELVSANQKLTKLDQAKSEFISIASHQLRTPLTIIKGYISMILEGTFGVLNTAEKVSLEKVYESNERLIQLVEGLLNVSRIESGRLQYVFADKDLGVLVQSVFDELTPAAIKKNLTFTLKMPAKLPLLSFDEEKMRQAIMNLIDNAIKYTKKGSVTVTLKKKAHGVEFCVSDSGMGVSAEDMKNLFKKFSRGTDSSLVHTEGTGLGLYVVREMVRAHGGKAWAESEGLGQGSRFYFYLPLKNKN